MYGTCDAGVPGSRDDVTRFPSRRISRIMSRTDVNQARNTLPPLDGTSYLKGCSRGVPMDIGQHWCLSCLGHVTRSPPLDEMSSLTVIRAGPVWGVGLSSSWGRARESGSSSVSLRTLWQALKSGRVRCNLSRFGSWQPSQLKLKELFGGKPTR